MTYQPNIPTGTIPLDQDYLNIQGNFSSLNSIYATDHAALTDTSANSGFHTNIHLVANSTIASNPPNNYPATPPTAVSLTGIVYSAQTNDGINPDETLYFLTGGNRNIQLTRNFTPSATSSGNSFIAGGIIINWGFKALSNSGSETGTVSFSQNFTSNPFNIQVTLQSKSGTSTSSSNNTLSVKATLVLTGGFTYVYNGAGSSDYPGFYWVAIGK